MSGPPGQEDGYAVYGPGEPGAWFGGPEKVVTVHDLVTVGAAAWIGLVRFFSALDLADVIRFPDRPTDDPLGHMFVDDRAVRRLGHDDEIWLRLVHVEAALAARTYADGPAVTVAVADPLLPHNQASFRVGPDGAERTDAAAELGLDVGALGALYLGGSTWRDLALAGRVREMRPGAVADADRLFHTDQAPWSGTSF